MFYVKIATLPLKESRPLFPSNLPLKIEVPSSPLFLKIWLEVIYIQPHPVFKAPTP